MTTEPSSLRAANAEPVLPLDGVILVTGVVPLRAVLTLLLSPPCPESPQVITEPSLLIAAKASAVATMLVTLMVPLMEVLTLLLSPPCNGSPHVITEPSDLIAAKAPSVAEMLSTLIVPFISAATLVLSPP